MPKFDFIIDTMRFSYSNISSFHNCKYGWYLTYIEHKERSNNWYAEFGSFMHLVLEKYFKYELDIFELAKFYKNNFSEKVVAPPPPFPVGIDLKYYQAGLDFFENFDFDRDAYEIIFIEEAINADLEKFNLVVKPDLLLKNKTTGEVTLVDYKTANPYNSSGKLDKKKFADYQKQMYLYAYFIQLVKNIKIDKVMIWMVRVGKEEIFTFDENQAKETLNWFSESIEQIKEEEDFKHNNTNEFFCTMLCSVKQWCKFAPGNKKPLDNPE